VERRIYSRPTNVPHLVRNHGRYSISTTAVTATAAGPKDPQAGAHAERRQNTHEVLSRRCLLHLLAVDASKGRLNVTKLCHNADIVESLSAPIAVYVQLTAHTQQKQQPVRVPKCPSVIIHCAQLLDYPPHPAASCPATLPTRLLSRYRYLPSGSIRASATQSSSSIVC